MSNVDMSLDENKSAAALVSADPAFAALEASGAPIIAVAGDPLQIVHVNDSARAVFGDDPAALSERLLRGEEPGARRLVELIDSVRLGPAPRLERLRFTFGSVAQTVTILCRRLSKTNGPSCFVIAALGVRPVVEAKREPVRVQHAEPLVEPEAAADVPTDESTSRLRASLTERFGARDPRFLWRTDEGGRFVDVTPVLAEVAGASNGDILGRTVAEVSNTFGLAEEFNLAMDQRKSWSGVEVHWPLDDFAARAPTTLGALPIFEQKRFLGFQGYGVLHLARASGPSNPPTPPAVVPAEAPAIATEYVGGNVISLRPPPTPRDFVAEQVAREAASALTPTEQTAFDEIARALGGLEAPASLAKPEETETAPPPIIVAAQEPESDAIEGRASEILDRLPVGALVARGEEALFANRTLLDYLGYADLAALNADGGLGSLFFGRPPQEDAARAPIGSVEVQAADGAVLDVDAHLQTLDWDGGPATLITLRRHRAVAAPSAKHLEAAVARADEALSRASREIAELRAVVDANPDGAAILTADGRIESVNTAFADFLGADRASLAGQYFTALLTEEDGRRLNERLSKATGAADVRAAQGWRLAIRTRRAGLAPVQISLRRLGDAQDRRYALFMRDLAPEREALEEVEALRAEADRASAAKSEFLARMSHEIRTPLNAIIGFAEVMMEERFGPIGSERYKEYLKDVHASGAHVLSLVNDLLDLSKIEAGKMELAFERVDANAIIAECVSIMQPQASQARIVMRLSLAPRLPRIRADERSLRQILLNLLSNGVKFNEPGGQVIVSSALTDAGYVLIRVKDTGLGMSDDEVGIALEPFKRLETSRKVSGTGLGLPVTKALIEANHASFTITSRRNEGTLIEIAFPPPQVLAAE